jgi:small-conductance mechanosensitive channel
MFRRNDEHNRINPAAFTRSRPRYERGIAALIVSFAAVVLASTLSASLTDHRLVVDACGLVCLCFGVIGTRLVAEETVRLARIRAGNALSGPLRVTVLLVGYGVVGLLTLDLLRVPLGHLLVGGAITGVVLGIAAQQALGNLFAGLVLLFTRPYVVGERVLVRSGALNGPLEGTITAIGLLYTTLQMDQGPTNIPNSALLASAVGPATPPSSCPASAPSSSEQPTLEMTEAPKFALHV